MKFGVGVDYSLRALMMLAEHYPAVTPLRVEEIAETQRIPENYLRRLLVELKRAGILLSQKGPSGGYLLARAPARITAAEVVQAVEGDFAPVECLVEGANALCRRDEFCSIRDMWRDVRDSVVEILSRTTLQSLIERRKGALSFQI
ncbi:MAG: Rrf2 family transcriptional regulator [Candidatus Binataceae bacterium]|jgi:Rrf2 family protein|nr:Rrf2 family transcriptional regulator [Candidatus Binataceae bacterium]